MVEKQGKYLMGRLIKLGQLLNEDKLIDAMLHPSAIKTYYNGWMLTNTEEHKSKSSQYVYGRLCKYSPDAEVVVVDEDKGSEETQSVPDMRIASSPFVYIPEHSGIVFMHVPGHIEYSNFSKYFCSIINKSHDAIFLGCEIDMLADMHSFTSKVSALESILKIEAVVFPPNPLYGPECEELIEYLKKRSAGKLTVEEESKGKGSLKSKLLSLMKARSDQEQSAIPEKIDITDAAILLAVDGYGRGSVTGMKGKRREVVSTVDNILCFEAPRNVNPDDLYHISNKKFQEVDDQRGLKHGKA